MTAPKPAPFVGALDDPSGSELATLKERQRKIDAYPQLVAHLRRMIADAAMQNDSSDNENPTAQAIGDRIAKAEEFLLSLGEL